MLARLSLHAADLQDNEASQQVESTQLAAAEIERLAEDKQRLAEHLQQEVELDVHFHMLLPSYFTCYSFHAFFPFVIIIEIHSDRPLLDRT